MQSFFCSSSHRVHHKELQVNLRTVYLFVGHQPVGLNNRCVFIEAVIQTQAIGFSNVRERSVNQKDKCFFITLYCINCSIEVGRNDCNCNNISSLLLYYSKYNVVNLPSRCVVSSE